MNSNDPGDDLVDRAIEALLTTAGPDKPPDIVVSQIRQAIANRQTTSLAKRRVSDTHRDRISWLALTVTLLLMVASGWVVGYHGRLFSEIAGRQSAANGSEYVFYTDGRVEVTDPMRPPQAILGPVISPRQGVT